MNQENYFVMKKFIPGPSLSSSLLGCGTRLNMYIGLKISTGPPDQITVPKAIVHSPCYSTESQEELLKLWTEPWSMELESLGMRWF